MTYTKLLADRTARYGPTCVGLDPIPAHVTALSVTSGAVDPAAVTRLLTDWGLTILEAAVDRVAVVKPQSAHFEVWGLAGLMALQQVCSAARQMGLPLILDVKRGDIDSTAASYAAAHLAEDPPPSAITADAITVNPFLGFDSIDPFVDRVADGEHGIFVLVRTSNAGAGDVQDATVDGTDVSTRLARWIHQANTTRCVTDAGGYGPVGAVVGLTQREHAERLREAMPSAWFLVPGLGAQAGDPAALRAFTDASGLGAVVSSSRGITFGEDAADWATYGAQVSARMDALAGQVSDALG